MATSSSEQPSIEKSTVDDFAPVVGGNGEAKQGPRKPRPKDRESALREADLIIEKLEESYRRTAAVLRSLNNIASKF